jgi:Glycosyl transferase family 2
MVSIILPSLNAREFLEQRMDSILEQTYGNWEAIVLDSHSDDGTWEYFEGTAAKDPRFRLYKIPRDGLYAALNRGIDLARGEFVHIATCDDTMHHDFLKESLSALRMFPSAGIVATDVQFIDAEGNDYVDSENRFGNGHVRTSVCGEVMEEINFRPVPHDCLLHLTFRTVYYSLTQLVVRAGCILPKHSFATEIGSIADFVWTLRLTSEVPTVHIPCKLATWRIHGDQLSLRKDPTRPMSMLAACKRTLEDLPLLKQRDRKALLLPGYRIVRDGHLLAPNFLTLALCGIVYFLWSMIARYPNWKRGLKAGRFGSTVLKDSWICFLLGMWNIRVRFQPSVSNLGTDT